MYQATLEETRRRAKERQMMKEGIEMWKRQKLINQENIVRDKREVRQLIEKHWPWGRPGGGAPNGCFVGLKNVHLEDIFPEEDMKKARRHVGALRFGQPGGGAPHVSQSGRRQIRFREDPALRFQWCQDLRRAVDNTIRYRTPREEQQKYKKQLDQLVEERKKIKEAEIKKDLDIERKMFIQTPPWGRRGPGGYNWRHPNAMGLLFQHSMGWTNEEVIKNLKNAQLKPQLRAKPVLSPVAEKNDSRNGDTKRNQLAPPLVKNGGGSELVPLLVRGKRPTVKVALSTTDVTRGDSMPTRLKVGEPEYLHELTKQVNYRNQQIKASHAEEVESCRRHFETWGSLWGRPGHGAPREDTHKYRMDLMWLYPQPVPMAVR